METKEQEKMCRNVKSFFKSIGLTDMIFPFQLSDEFRIVDQVQILRWSPSYFSAHTSTLVSCYFLFFADSISQWSILVDIFQLPCSNPNFHSQIANSLHCYPSQIHVSAKDEEMMINSHLSSIAFQIQFLFNKLACFLSLASKFLQSNG